MYLSCISSKLTHGLRKRFPYKKLTQPYAHAGFAYAQLRYDNTLIKHEHGGLSNGSVGLCLAPTLEHRYPKTTVDLWSSAQLSRLVGAPPSGALKLVLQVLDLLLRLPQLSPRVRRLHQVAITYPFKMDLMHVGDYHISRND